MSTPTPAPDHAVHRVARDYCLAPSRTIDAPLGSARYGRMFPHLPALSENLPALETAGQTGGVCDAAAVLARAGAVSDEATEAAGWPFFGQIVAHDITADRSPVGPDADVATLRNARSPKLNLELLLATGRSATPTSTTCTTRPVRFSVVTAGTCPATRRASRSSAIRATTSMCSRTGCTWRCCTPTTAS
jgi:hypothetical protein